MTLSEFQREVEAAGGTFRFGVSNRREDVNLWIGIFKAGPSGESAVMMRDGMCTVVGRGDRLDGIARGGHPLKTAIRRAKTRAYTPAKGRD